MEAFGAALAFTLNAEGGYSDNPNDHGGSTNFGITQVAYDAYTGGGHSVHEITRSIAEDFYHKMVWGPAHCDSMPLPLSVAHFDWAVNHGVAGAIKGLQLTLGVAADGQLGPITIGKINAADPQQLTEKYLEYREQWYKNDAQKDPSQAVFLKGWLSRVTRLRGYIQGLNG